MERQEICEWLTYSIKQPYDLYPNFSSNISSAIYDYGDPTSYALVAHIPLKDKGILVYEHGMYYHLSQKGFLLYDEIKSIEVEYCEGYQLKINHQMLHFDDDIIIAMARFLSSLCDVSIKLSMPVHQKIDYCIQQLFFDLKEDMYENVVLNDHHIQQMEDIVQTLCNDAEEAVKKVIELCDELDVDSEEVQQLEQIYQDIQEDKQVHQAQSMYDEMMKRMSQGDHGLFDQMKSMMNGLGIHEDDLKGKSPQEIDAYIDNLCQRFGVSRSMIDRFINKIKK